jgi:PleD family two-component response regulator
MTTGVAYRAKDETIDKWIQRADEKLYYGKQNGRNRVVV